MLASGVNGLSGGGAGVAEAPAVLTTLTKIAEATSTGTNIVGPGTILPGDLIVLLDRGFGGPPTTAVPTDFVPISNLTLGSTRQILSVKIAAGAEASANLTGMAGTFNAKALIVLRGNIPITSATVQDAGQQATTGNPAAQVANASGGAPPLVVIGAYGAPAAINPRTFSPAKDGEVLINSTGTFVALAWKIYDTSPADETIDMDDEDATNSEGSHLQTGYIECS